jgi:hypothetical protein
MIYKKYSHPIGAFFFFIALVGVTVMAMNHSHINDEDNFIPQYINFLFRLHYKIINAQ